MNVFESCTEHTLYFEVPGLGEKDIEVEVSGERLTVSGKRAEPKAAEGEFCSHVEAPGGAFCRTVTIPGDLAVDPERVKAILRHGVLKITVPKAEPDRSSRIRVSVE